MKKVLFAIFIIFMSGCASNPMANGYRLVKTPAFDPLFIASTYDLPNKILLKSPAVMYYSEMPMVAELTDTFIITESEVFLSEWQPSSYVFKHKVRLNFAEIKSVKNISIERKYLGNSQCIQITTKKDDVLKFWLIDDQAPYAKSLIDKKI